MGQLIFVASVTVNGAFEAPEPTPNGWLTMDPGWVQASLEMWEAADAMVIGRKTYEGLAAVWPQLASVPGYEAYAHRMNSMQKYVASNTLNDPLTWNATLLEGDLAASIGNLKAKHQGNLVVTGAGELARNLVAQGLVDEFRFAVNPCLWSTGPRIFDELVTVPLELVATTTFPSGVVQIRYRPAGAEAASDG
ncbi:deaminase [Natronospirillum operosum]|uniref:Deaminase n=1 Tax=Natronospirillum operosum TaxID=2759953 RepID=A0A4Z0W4S9_9GAMM|nr:dihydrofolate reductase family protein [Natronospirillum operosum]TGG91691.1 deaminase [Natronospirillum operosum]